MSKLLTDRQTQILEWVKVYIAEEGYSPSIREIGMAFNIGSLRGVTVHLDALERKGHIARSNAPRSIHVLGLGNGPLLILEEVERRMDDLAKQLMDDGKYEQSNGVSRACSIIRQMQTSHADRQGATPWQPRV